VKSVKSRPAYESIYEFHEKVTTASGSVSEYCRLLQHQNCAANRLESDRKRKRGGDISYFSTFVTFICVDSVVFSKGKF
jgi:hypothetical protein